MNADSILGCLLGTAVGDSLGLPYEGLSSRRAERLLGPPDRQRFLWGRGMVSDDTEHTCLVAQALIEAGGDPPKFQLALARRLRWWLLGIPAGIGLATLRSTLRLWCGLSPERSGVFSAGNGPAMRSALLGVVCADCQQLAAWVRASTRLTHTDPRAEQGALAVALAAHHAARWGLGDPEAVWRHLQPALAGPSDELRENLRKAVESVHRGESTPAFARSLELARGVTGYVNHTVPVALQACWTNPCDVRGAVMEVIRCGGDTDTTAAIAGAIVGAAVGESGIPQDWLTTLVDWPRSVTWMRQLATALAQSGDSPHSRISPGVPVVGLLLRNMVFAIIVLGHGFRRLGPPYD